MNKAIFLDRDGVINRKAPEGDYITRWEAVEFLPGVFEAVRKFNAQKFLVIVVTNQRGVTTNTPSEVELRIIHENMLKTFAENGSEINAFYYCPHASETNCGCRKPSPGMMLRAAQEHGIDLAASWMVGDSLCDIEAGKAAGCKTVWLTNSEPIPAACGQPDFCAETLGKAVALIIEVAGQ